MIIEEMQKYVPLTKEQDEQLRAPLPPEAVTPHPTKSYLSNIKGIYVTERLNDVFGIGGWRIKLEDKPFIGKMAIVKVIFTVPAHGIYLECFGGNDNVDPGDALKGSTTDAMSKIGSFLQIGAAVYKGEQKGNNTPVQKAQPGEKPWMSEQVFEATKEVMTNGSRDPKETFDSACKAMNMKKEYRDVLQKLVK